MGYYQLPTFFKIEYDIRMIMRVESVRLHSSLSINCRFVCLMIVHESQAQRNMQITKAMIWKTLLILSFLFIYVEF
jgi:hypothetical protein